MRPRAGPDRRAIGATTAGAGSGSVSSNGDGVGATATGLVGSGRWGVPGRDRTVKSGATGAGRGVGGVGAPTGAAATGGVSGRGWIAGVGGVGVAGRAWGIIEPVKIPGLGRGGAERDGWVRGGSGRGGRRSPRGSGPAWKTTWGGRPHCTCPRRNGWDEGGTGASPVSSGLSVGSVMGGTDRRDTNEADTPASSSGRFQG